MMLVPENVNYINLQIEPTNSLISRRVFYINVVNGKCEATVTNIKVKLYFFTFDRIGSLLKWLYSFKAQRLL